MNHLRVLLHLIRADFLERTRRYSFLITLGIMLYVGYLSVPSVDAGVLTVNLGNLRGVYNSAWVGSMIALLTTMLLSLPGFYLVKNAVARDRETRVGQIIATTPLPKVLYTLGKALSNFIFLAVILLVVVAGAGATQLLRGEVTQLDLGQLFAPFLFISLPAMAVVATVAVLFEVIPFLQGGFGNLAYFVLYIVTIIVSMSGVTFTEQGVIEAPINDLFGASVIGASMLGEAHAAYPQRQLDFGIGYAKIEGPIETFRWVGVTWTAGIAAQRLVWVGVALGIALLAALIFDRFDPARLSRRGRKGQGLLACLTAPSPRPRGRIWAMLRSIRLPRLNLARFITLPAWPLPPFARVLVAELRLALKGLRWWWYAVALGLIVAGATRPAPEALNLLPIAWIWPVLLWSEFGVREARHHTGPVVFSTPHPLQRQFPAMWVAGVLVSVLCGSGVALRLLLAGEMMHLLAWVVAALFIPTLALTAGVWSGSSKLFEALYVVLWYLGPVSGLAALDFMGTTPGSLAQGMPWIYLGITAALLGLAYVGRARMLKH